MSVSARMRGGPGKALAPDTQGILYLCAGLFIFSFQDIIIKLLSPNYPVHELVFVRGLLAMPLLLAMVHLDGGFKSLASKAPGFMVIRACCMFISYMTFYLAIAAVPITTAIAMFFTAPLMITALAVPLLGEAVGLRRWMGVVIGFIGVLIMFRPGIADLEPALLLPLVSAFTYSLAQVLTRRVGTQDSAAAMAFYSAMIFTYLGGFIGFVLHFLDVDAGDHPSWQFLLMPWQMPGGIELVMLMTIGMISALGFYLLTQAYRVGEANVVAPFEYTGLLWASILTFVVWGNLPNVYTLAGAALIVSSGIYVLKRESRKLDEPLAADGPYRTR